MSNVVRIKSARVPLDCCLLCTSSGLGAAEAPAHHVSTLRTVAAKVVTWLSRCGFNNIHHSYQLTSPVLLHVSNQEDFHARPDTVARPGEFQETGYTAGGHGP
jgi:hypothetical protein